MARPKDELRKLVFEITNRQMQVLDLIVEGFTTPEIAERLKIGFKTAEAHMINLYKKLGAKNTAQAITKSFRIGLVK